MVVAGIVLVINDLNKDRDSEFRAYIRSRLQVTSQMSEYCQVCLFYRCHH